MLKKSTEQAELLFIRASLSEIQQSDWLVPVENHALKTIDNDFNRGRLTIRNTQLRLIVLVNFSFVG